MPVNALDIESFILSATPNPTALNSPSIKDAYQESSIRFILILAPASSKARDNCSARLNFCFLKSREPAKVSAILSFDLPNFCLFPIIFIDWSKESFRASTAS